MDDDSGFCIYTPDTHNMQPLDPDFLATMSIDSFTLQTYGYIPVNDQGPSHSSVDYPFIQTSVDNYVNMENGTPWSSAAPDNWTSSSSMVPFQFPELLAETFQPSFFHPDVQFADSIPPYPAPQSMSPLDPSNYFAHPLAPGFVDFPGITTPEPEQLPEVVGSLPDFQSLYDATSDIPPVLPVPHSRTEIHQDHFPSLVRPPTPPTRSFGMHNYEAPNLDFKKDPEAMRRSWMDNLAQFVDHNKVLKVFSKHAKEKVATMNTLKASAARRKVAARFKCSIEGCGADFTRKHNLENHLKSHCGMTDRSCYRCGKRFTTVPVCKRHEKSCGKPSSSSKIRTPKEFLNAVTAQSPS